MKTKNLITTIFLTFFFFLLSSFSFAQWYPQNSGTMTNLESVCFTDTLNGWATGYEGIILHTDDGGDNWEQQTSGTANNLYCVHFTDTNHGWTVGGFFWPPASSLHRTVDGGFNWEEIDDWWDGSNPDQVYFSDTLNGWILSLDIQHTSDGGETWETQFDYGGFAYQNPGGLYFTDSLTGWAVKSTYDGSTGYTRSYILHTTDGGSYWYYQLYANDHFVASLTDIYFTNSLKGWAVGGYYSNWGIILMTTDGGNNWDTTYINDPGALHSIYFSDAFNGIAVGTEGLILYTSDGGLTWEAESSGTTKNLNSIYFAENGYGWAVGDSGTILKADYSHVVGIHEFKKHDSKLKVRCYFNSFTTSTTFEYKLQHPTTVQITIYNHLGEKIEVIQQNQLSGKQQVVWNAEGLPGGVYFCVLKIESEIQTLKMIKLK